MNLTDCYRMLGLRVGASYGEIKASYRRLARQYHPDVSSQDQQARDKFIALTEAYKYLLTVVKPSEDSEQNSSADAEGANTPSSPTPTKVKITRKQPTVQFNPQLSDLDRKLKQESYDQLQRLLKVRSYARAIALVEGLSQRLPNDVEVRQWQAITYHHCGRHFVDQHQFDKARAYLKKALRTDPSNRSLWAEVEKEFRRMEPLL